MELFRYVFCLKAEEEVLLINLVNGIVIRVSNGDYNNIVNDTLYKLDDDCLSILISKGFLVQSKYNSFSINSGKCVALNLNLTNICNFDCNYCYFKANNKEKFNTSIDEKQLLLWINKYIVLKGYDVYINYLGGEPLIEIEKLINISRKVQKLALKNSLNYYGEVTTNGYNLSPKIAKKLLKAGIKCIQVTIDGDREEHNRIRCCKNGKDTYDTIMKNVSMCKNIIPITIRININKKMYIKAICKLLDDLKRFGIKKIYFSCIEKNYIDSCNQDSADDYALNDTEALERYIEVWKMQKNYGFEFIQKIPSILGNCIAKNPNGYTINYDGKMYLCPSTCGIEEFLIDDLYDYKSIKKKLIEGESKCNKCVLFPICMGGCDLINFLSGNHKVCRKEYIEELLQNYFKFKYLK